MHANYNTVTFYYRYRYRHRYECILKPSVAEMWCRQEEAEFGKVTIAKQQVLSQCRW